MKEYEEEEKIFSIIPLLSLLLNQRFFFSNLKTFFLIIFLVCFSRIGVIFRMGFG
jgi:hypothetical protein